MKLTNEHVQRIEQELKEVGMTAYGGHKFVIKYLPKVIHSDEHIKAILYGRYKENPSAGLMGLSAGMLVATDRRIIFLDHKPGFTSMDELTYDIATGIGVSKAGIGSTVTLHTRIGDYAIHFANPDGIERFVNYIEERRLNTAETSSSDSSGQSPLNLPEAPVRPVQGVMEEDAIVFLRNHDIGVLSTIDRTGNPHGATIYYRIDSQNSIYMITKSSTGNARQ